MLDCRGGRSITVGVVPWQKWQRHHADGTDHFSTLCRFGKSRAGSSPRAGARMWNGEGRERKGEEDAGAGASRTVN